MFYLFSAFTNVMKTQTNPSNIIINLFIFSSEIYISIKIRKWLSLFIMEMYKALWTKELKCLTIEGTWIYTSPEKILFFFFFKSKDANLPNVSKKYAKTIILKYSSVLKCPRWSHDLSCFHFDREVLTIYVEVKGRGGRTLMHYN